MVLKNISFNLIMILLIFLIIILLIYINTQSNIIILSKKELQNILLSDSDNYYKSFTDLDLKARNVESIDEYKNLIINSPININNNLKQIIINHINRIDKLFNNYNTIGFNGNKANSIKWIIGIVNNNKYENGFPHTRNNIIIIPKKLINKKLISTLIHEKIHIYQKIYPDDINKYLKFNNFTNFCNKPCGNFNIRSNPDTDNKIYSKSNKLFLSIYNKNPKHINDVIYYPINKSKYEHPFEFMAYNIENHIMKKIK